ncbi:MAG: dethiobiotin synthase, partial [Verrucomicrobiota bacterium]
MKHGVFVSGTDTGVGKTQVACLLVRALRQSGVDAVGMKPFCCGDRLDAERLDAANEGSVPMGLVNPVWLRVPASPYTASLVENRGVDVSLAREAYETLRAAHEVVVVEGVGGWAVPLTQSVWMNDLVVEWGLPVGVVAANRLGALNHTRLTVDAVRAAGVPLRGILWNEVHPVQGDPAQLTNRAVWEQLMPGLECWGLEHGAEA